MRKMITLMAVVALAACDSATASDRQGRTSGGGATLDATHASFIEIDP